MSEVVGVPMTVAERVARHRARRLAEGLTEVRGLWLPPELHGRVHTYGARLLHRHVPVIDNSDAEPVRESAPFREVPFTRLREVFDFYGAMPRRSDYYCVSRCKDGALVMVFKRDELPREGDTLVHRSRVCDWDGVGTHPTSRVWVDELNAGVGVARLGWRYRAGKFAALPDMVGRVRHWDGDYFDIVFTPKEGTKIGPP